jgi:putative DNA primase/helicase
MNCVQSAANVDRVKLAAKLKGKVSGRWIVICGPNHSKDDLSLAILFTPKARDGFIVHSFAGDDPALCRRYVNKTLKRRRLRPIVLEAGNDAVATKQRIALALSLWAEAQPIEGTPAEIYLMLRGCAPPIEESWPKDLRFHAACPFGSYRFPGLVGLTRDAITGEPTGIHRTALTDDGASKRVMPSGLQSKMMCGRASRAAIQLQTGENFLGLAEGIETALSAGRIFKMPVWAAMSAGGIRDFPVIHGIEFVRIFADHDEVGLSAARMCKRRYKAAGIDVEIRYPPEPQSDWNDFHSKEIES